jgi:hypothetical protein
MTGMTESAPEPKRVSLEQIHGLMRMLLSVPRGWLACVGLAAVVSLFRIARSADGGLAVEFHVTNTTVLLLALAWLPAVLAVVAVAGGGVKTPAGEATTTGLLQVLQVLDVTARQAILPPLVAGLEQAEAVIQPGERDQVRTLRQAAEGELAALPLDAQAAQQELDRLAVAYDTVRAQEQSGGERTMHMSELVVRARALAVKAHLSEPQVHERCMRFGEAPPGERIITLTLIEALHRHDCLPAVLGGIGNSRSAFEQYRALRVAQRLLPSLDGAQRAQLLQVINEQRGPGGYIVPGTDRLPLAEQITSVIAAGMASS